MFPNRQTVAPNGAKNSRAQDPAKAEKRRRFWRKTRRRVFWTLAVLFVAHSSLNIYASVLLGHELAAIRQNGDPVRFSEIEPPAVPAAQNAALVYQQATKALRLSPDEKNALEARQRDRTPQIEHSIESALQNNRRALDLTRRAAFMAQCRFPLNWKGDPTRFRFPYYAEVRQLARLLAEQARAEARHGDEAWALRDVRALFGMAHHLSKEPYFIGFLAAQSVDITANRTLGQVLQSVPLTVAQARAIEASLPSDDWTKAFRRSLVGERMMGIFAFESLGQAEPSTDDEDDSPFPVWTRYPLLWVARPVIRLDEVQTLRLWRQPLDSPQSQQVPRPVEFGRTQDAAIQNTPFYAVLTKILFPVFTRASDNRDGAEVRRRQREVALSLACYRTAHGVYPAQLQDAAKLWGQQLPLDPYSQKPFVYRQKGKGFVLYSVGVNRVDDGGIGPYSPGKHLTSADDLAWWGS